jgi:hypothetical protein
MRKWWPRQGRRELNVDETDEIKPRYPNAITFWNKSIISDFFRCPIDNFVEEKLVEFMLESKQPLKMPFNLDHFHRKLTYGITLAY